MPDNRIRLTRASYVLALLLTLSLLVPWAPLPARVREMCGEPPIPDESLCNVDEGLRDAVRLVEQVLAEPDADIPSGVGTIARRRLVSVEWYPNFDPTPIPTRLMGLYDAESHRIFVPPGLRPQPLRVRAAVMAHELGHATLLLDGGGAGLRAPDWCLDFEARAFKVGMIVYERARRQVQEPDGIDDADWFADRHLNDEVELWRRLSGGQSLTAEGLGDLADRHVFHHGSTTDCTVRPNA